ncbi:MAG: hypothetical protein AAFQ80_08310 [Cyanobacteria bacterium J06621_8]
MSEKKFIENIFTDSEYSLFQAGIARFKEGDFNYRELNLTDIHDVSSLSPHSESSSNLIFSTDDVLSTGPRNELLSGLGISSGVSNDHTVSRGNNPNGSAIANASANATAIGIDNAGIIATKKGRDIIFGIGLASVTSVAGAESEGIFSSSATASARAIASAVGLKNSGTIEAGDDSDAIFGFANVVASSEAKAEAQLTTGNDVAVTATSESGAFVETSAIGIENLGRLLTGKGHDLIVGGANSWSSSFSAAEAFAANTAALLTNQHPPTVALIEEVFASSTANSEALTQSLTIGIANSDLIHTTFGHDIIIGLALSSSPSKAIADAETEATAQNIATAQAEATSLAITESIAVGIVNLGKISTGNGNDVVLGIAVNEAIADADAHADADANAEMPDSDTDTDTIADTFNSFDIGIDNTSGIIKTDIGNDQVVGHGAVGIQGGLIFTGKQHDRVIAYGSTVGFQDGTVRLGRGNDYFQAAIANFVLYTDDLTFAEEQSGAIKDALITGGDGNDTFEIGGFSSRVVIDGGSGHDVFRLWSSIDDYQITLGSAANQELIIRGEEGVLRVKQVEELYFGDRNHAFSYSDFA